MNSITFTGDTPYLKRIVDAVLALDPVTADAKPKKQKVAKAPEPESNPAEEANSTSEPTAEIDDATIRKGLMAYVTKTDAEKAKAKLKAFGVEKVSDLPQGRRQEFLLSLAA